MSKKSVAKNYMYNLIYQILVAFIPLVSTPYVSRVLGAENIGIYSYTLSITTYFILFGSLGIAMYGQREIAYLQDKPYERSKTFIEIFLLRIITLFISMIIFYISFCYKNEYNIYYKILLLEIISSIIDISWFFQGLEEFKKTITRNLIVKIISIVCIFLFVKSANDLKLYFLIYVLSNFIGNLTLWFYLFKYFEKVNLKEINIFKHLKPTIALFIPQIAVQIYTVLDKTMIGIIVADKSEVGFYEQAQKFVKLVMTIATSLGTVMAPRIAYTYAKNDHKKINEYMFTSCSFILMLSIPLMFGLISITNDFVPVFFGNGYDKVKILMKIISPIIVIIGLSNVIGVQYLLPTKQQNKYTISVIVGALVNFFLNLILINKYQSVGASIATVIAESTVTIVQLFLVRNNINLKIMFSNLYKYIFSGLIMFFVTTLIGFLINNEIISILLQVLCGSIIYVSTLFVLKEQTITMIFTKVKSKLIVN